MRLEGRQDSSLLTRRQPPCKRPVARFKIGGSNDRHTVFGQEARTLRALLAASTRGITSGEVSVCGWGYRLAHYVMKLRRHGLDIAMAHEAHAGGWHGRYTLETPIEMLSGGVI